MHLRKIAQIFVFPLLFFSMVALCHEDAEPATGPVTAGNPQIPTDELSLLVKPLTVEELKVEANAWMQLLRDKTHETSRAEMAIKYKNKTIEKAEELQESIEDTQEVLQDVTEASQKAGETGDLEAIEEARELAEQAQDSVEQTVDSIHAVVDTSRQISQDSSVQSALDTARETKAEVLSEQAGLARDVTEKVAIAADRAAAAAQSGNSRDAARLAGETEEAAKEATTVLLDTSEIISQSMDQQRGVSELVQQTRFEETAQLAVEVAEREMSDKKDILLSVTELRNQHTALTDRLNIVLDELSAKLGRTTEGAEHEFIVPFRLYSQSVNTISIDVTDTQTAVSNIMGWIRSDLGGVRLARNLGYFLLAVFSFWMLGRLLGALVNRALIASKITAELMRSVLVRSIRRVAVIVGILIGLSAMDINVGPILAVVGAAGFVIAFALQDTLSNFASGIMIMIYRPFDMGDLISVGGVTGEARSMNLVSTTIATRDNQLLIIPNNTIWGNIIINITGSKTRRVDLIFRIGYEDDIDLAQNIMLEVLESHPLVLKDPEPIIAVEELGAVSVNLICRPWAKTADYWIVYREVTRSIKERFEQAGLVPPFLQLKATALGSEPTASSMQTQFPIS
jgi:small conductance mechanosensitive channel